MPLALYALTAGAFGIGVTEFVIMGLLLAGRRRSRRVDPCRGSADLGLCASASCVGAPIMTIATSTLAAQDRAAGADGHLHAGQSRRVRWPRTTGRLMAARVLTAFAHGTFFGVGSVVATSLVAPKHEGVGYRGHVHRPDGGEHSRRAVRHVAGAGLSVGARRSGP